MKLRRRLALDLQPLQRLGAGAKPKPHVPRAAEHQYGERTQRRQRRRQQALRARRRAAVQLHPELPQVAQACKRRAGAHGVPGREAFPADPKLQALDDPSGRHQGAQRLHHAGQPGPDMHALRQVRAELLELHGSFYGQPTGAEGGDGRPAAGRQRGQRGRELGAMVAR